MRLDGIEASGTRQEEERNRSRGVSMNVSLGLRVADGKGGGLNRDLRAILDQIIVRRRPNA